MFPKASFFAACLAILATNAPAQDGMLEELYGRGVHAFFSGNFRESFDSLNTAVVNGSRDPRVYYYRGLVLNRLGRPDEARGDFHTAVQFEMSSGLPYSVGKALERIQGPERVMLEANRRAARVAIHSTMTATERARYEQVRRAESELLRGAVPPAVAAPRAVLPPDASDPFTRPLAPAPLPAPTIEAAPVPVPAATTPPPATDPFSAPATPVPEATTPPAAPPPATDPFSAPPTPAAPVPATPAPDDPFGAPVPAPTTPAPVAPAPATPPPPAPGTDPFGEAPSPPGGVAPTTPAPLPATPAPTPPASDDPFAPTTPAPAEPAPAPTTPPANDPFAPTPAAPGTPAPAPPTPPAGDDPFAPTPAPTTPPAAP